MGMLYYECKGCSGCIGIQAQFIGNVKCVNCDILIEGKSEGVPRFQTWNFRCEGCDFKLSFEGMHCRIVSCVKCNKIMKDADEVTKDALEKANAEFQKLFDNGKPPKTLKHLLEGVSNN